MSLLNIGNAYGSIEAKIHLILESSLNWHFILGPSHVGNSVHRIVFPFARNSQILTCVNPNCVFWYLKWKYDCKSMFLSDSSAYREIERVKASPKGIQYGNKWTMPKINLSSSFLIPTLFFSCKSQNEKIPWNWFLLTWTFVRWITLTLAYLATPDP